MSFRRWLNIATVLIIVITLYFSRHELEAAWELLGRVNIWILLLVLPLQFVSYYATGAMIFSYLRAKGDLKEVHSTTMAQMALELNFVNHMLPTGGFSGASYMTWRLSKLGVNSARAALAQVVRFGATFSAFLVLLMLAVLLITIDGSINRLTILVSSALASIIIFGTIVVIYVISSTSRLQAFSRLVDRCVNSVWRHVFRRRTPLLKKAVIKGFFEDLHDDYLALREDPKVLRRPFWWGIIFNLAEVGAFVVTFWALGTFINPAPILIALGIAGVAGFFLLTPGGAGGYEVLMILFLTSASISPGTALAGVLLTRVILILLTIGSGYIFYHLALKKYGTSDRTTNS